MYTGLKLLPKTLYARYLSEPMYFFLTKQTNASFFLTARQANVWYDSD